MGNTKNPRVVLQFNDTDFRHTRVLEILRRKPRSKTELIVNAILHYVSCPDAAQEFSREWIAEIVKDVIREMQKNGELHLTGTAESNEKSVEEDEVIADLSGIMSRFRGKE